MMTKIANVACFNPVKSSLSIMLGLSLLIAGQTGTMAATAKASAKSTTKVTVRSRSAKPNLKRSKRSGTVVAAKAPATADTKKPLIPVHADFKLENGLRVVFSEDHSVPVVAVAILYDVGARNEKKGRSGFAHLFEHMMFEGSENVGKTEHFKYVESAGGSLNGSTHPDFTNYFEKLPSNQAELALWLESDRMRSLKLTPENFQNQLETVKQSKKKNGSTTTINPMSLRRSSLMKCFSTIG
jgi:zinc protease